MKNVKSFFLKALRPPKWIVVTAPPLVYSLLIYILVTGKSQNILAYVTYVLSAYCLAIWIIPMPGLIKAFKQSKAVQRLTGFEIGRKYRGDLAFRGSISIYQGMTVNFLYVVFRVAVGAIYASVWFISMAVYYLILGILRLYLIVCYRNRNDGSSERCYTHTARLLFLLNIPMGGMIILMVLTNSGYSYPGYVIYVSALYTFYTIIRSAINIVKYRRLGDPILSAAKVLDLIAAMMSVLGLQTAMLTQFNSNGESFRRLMNALTGSAVWLAVIITAVYMLIHGKKIKQAGEKL